MPEENDQVQWTMMVSCYHGPQFGHRIDIEQLWRGRNESSIQPGGRWKGLGMPEPVYETARALVLAVFDEHMLSRYGIAGELPTKWAGDPDPF